MPSARPLAELRGALRRIPQVETRQVTTGFRPLPPVLDATDRVRHARITFAGSKD